MSGKGSKRRNEDTAAVEANWPTNWNVRGQAQDTQATDSGAAQQATNSEPRELAVRQDDR